MEPEEKEYYRFVRQVFAILAPFYDLSGAVLAGVRRKVADFTGAPRGARILDVATGTGKQAFAFAEKGRDVTGIDLSEAMLKVAVRKNKEAKFAVADATKLPFRDGCFDIACVSFALHEMPLTIMQRTLTEMVRVTRPQGIVVVVDYALPGNKVSRFLVYNFVRLYEGKYYSLFIKTDPNALLEKAGIVTVGELPVLLGAGRMIKGLCQPKPAAN